MDDYYEDVGLQDPEERREREEREAVAEQKLVGAVSGLLASENGRFFLKYMVNFCGVADDIMLLDAGVAAYRSGKRSVGLKLLDLCAKCKETTFLFERDNDV